MAAAYLKKLSSGVGFKGLLRKVAIFAIVAVANVIDRSMHLNGAIRIVIICFFCANEGLSILENSAKMGLPIPQKLIDVLEQLKEKNKEGGHSDG
jgi:toxin secretion/phage lysis holin